MPAAPRPPYGVRAPATAVVPETATDIPRSPDGALTVATGAAAGLGVRNSDSQDNNPTATTIATMTRSTVRERHRWLTCPGSPDGCLPAFLASDGQAVPEMPALAATRRGYYADPTSHRTDRDAATSPASGQLPGQSLGYHTPRTGPESATPGPESATASAQWRGLAPHSDRKRSFAHCSRRSTQ